MQTSFWDTDPCLRSNGTTTQPQDSKTEHARAGSQTCTCTTGMCDCSIHPRGRDAWIACMRGSLAKIFQSPVMALALRDRAADSGKRLKGSLAYYDLTSCSWRTAQQSLLGDSMLYSETWPSWGMTRNGVCYLRPPWVPRTYALDGGALHGVPTPTKSSADKEVIGSQQGRNIVAYAKLMPTPIANDAEKRGDFDPNKSWGLAGYAKLFPTPTAAAANQGQNLPDGKRGQTLVGAARGQTWATPLARDYKSHKFSAQRQAKRAKERRGKPLNEQVGGQLNPQWVEWLMGWPIGSTASNV